MTPEVLLLLMVLAHIVEDFHIQGIMAQMKQKSWWYDQFAKASYEQPDRDMGDIMGTYGRDYLVALFLHGLEWAICVSIPVIFYQDFALSTYMLFAITAMAVMHAVIDHLKCNLYTINLVEDQAFHIMQVFVLWAVAVYLRS